ncbi:sugar ABC transporter substrate-binding protein [Opitutaceae bacterium TAV5]|nr:sugar ABC transporter substrate-binding protein [Opitutaceae bacterium TAV5]
MKRLVPLLGLALLVAAFATAALRIAARHRAAADSGVRVLRIGHWLIHAGMPEAFAEAIADYEKLHPGVRIEQNAVPIKTWFAWQRAQWTGGTTPDIMQLGKGTGLPEVGRYYTPLSPHLDEPNPYNTGTPLEGVPWRQTFIDGLNGSLSYFPALGETCGIPLQVSTFRLYYNRDLLRAVTGSDTPPRTLDGFLALAAQTRDYNRRRSTALVPLSVCGPYAQGLFDLLDASMTQSLMERSSPSRTLQVDAVELAESWLAGDWSLDSPEVRRSLELQARLFDLCQPGFLTLQREDAHFNFVTGRALFLYAGSWDYTGVMQEAAFDVGIARFPLPAAGEGHWGEYSLGPVSEATWMEAVFGIANTAPDPALALDFLRFLTSHRTAEKFAATSRRLSAVVDVPVAPELSILRPDLDGSFSGLPLRMAGLPGANALLRFQQNLHLLGATGEEPAPNADDSASRRVERFTQAVAPAWPAALHRDLDNARRRFLTSVRLGDSRLLFAALDPVAAPGDAALASVLESTIDLALSGGLIEEATPSSP